MIINRLDSPNLPTVSHFHECVRESLLDGSEDGVFKLITFVLVNLV